MSITSPHELGPVELDNYAARASMNAARVEQTATDRRDYADGAGHDYTPEELRAMEDDAAQHPMREAHQETPAMIAATVTVYRVHALESKFWHVVVSYSTPNNPDGLTLTCDYLAWSDETPSGVTADEAATDLLGRAVTAA